MGTSTIEATGNANSLQQNARNITRDSTGVLHVVYYESDGSYDQIYYENSDDDGLTWGNRTALTSESYNQQEASICVDSNDDLHVVWNGSHSGKTSYTDIRYIKYSGSWGSIADIGNNTYGERSASICVDSSDNVHVFYRWNTTAATNNHRIYYTVYISSWSTPVIVSVDNYNQAAPTATIDDDDYIHLVWPGGYSSHSGYNNKFYRKKTTSWQTIVRITAQNRHSGQGHCIIESDGSTLWILFHGFSSTSVSYTQIRYAKYTGSWGAAVDITSGNDFHRQTSPQINSNDDIYSPFRHQNGTWEIFLLTWNGSSWNETAETSSSSNNQDWPEEFYSYHPSSKPNMPTAGYAYAWADYTTIKFKYSSDLAWGGAAYQKQLTETLSITDSISTQASYYRTFTESLGVADSLNTQSMYYRAFTESLSVTDTLSTQAAFFRKLTETINVVDSLSTQAAFYRKLTETISIADSFSTQAAFYKKLTETISIADSLSTQTAFYKKLTETINVVDSLSTQTEFFRKLTEAISISDDISAGSFKKKFLTETISISDSISTTSTFRRKFTETINIVDSVSTSTSFYRKFVESINISDLISTQASFYRKLLETLNVTDNISTQTAYKRKFTETIFLSDLIKKNFKKILTESLSITDAITANKFIYLKLTESITISDNFSRVVEYHRKFTESINISDEINFIGRVISDPSLWPVAKILPNGKAYQLRNFTIKLSDNSGSTVSGELAEEVE